MPRDDERRLLQDRVAPLEDQVDVFERCRLVAGSRRGRLETVHDHAGRGVVGRALFEVVDDQIARAADAALGIVPGRKGVARAAGHEGRVDLTDLLRTHRGRRREEDQGSWNHEARRHAPPLAYFLFAAAIFCARPAENFSYCSLSISKVPSM